MDTQTLIILALAFLLLLAMIAVFVLALLFMRARNSAENKLLRWQQTRLDMIRKELAESAQKQLDNWRKAEIDNVRTAMRESVRNELTLLFEQWKVDYEKSIRKDAASKSQSTLVGKITEHFIPYLPEFSYNPQDARFLGSPIDFIVFDGLSEGALRKIIFIEVKTNAGSLTARERQIRDVVNEKAVEWISIKRKMDIAAEMDGE